MSMPFPNKAFRVRGPQAPASTVQNRAVWRTPGTSIPQQLPTDYTWFVRQIRTLRMVLAGFVAALAGSALVILVVAAIAGDPRVPTGPPRPGSALVGDPDEVGVFLMMFMLLAVFVAHSFLAATVPVSVLACAQKAGIVFCPPPQWPRPPAGWVPPADWSSDPSWPPPPAGWTFWRNAQEQPSENPEALLTVRARRQAVRWDGFILVAAGVIAALAYRGVPGGWSWLMASCLVAGGLCAIWWSRPGTRPTVDALSTAAMAPPTAVVPTATAATHTVPITSPWQPGELIIREDTAIPFVSDVMIAAIVARHRQLLRQWQRRALVITALAAGFVTSLVVSHSGLDTYWPLFVIYGIIGAVWTLQLAVHSRNCRRQPRAYALMSYIRDIRGRAVIDTISLDIQDALPSEQLQP